MRRIGGRLAGLAGALAGLVGGVACLVVLAGPAAAAAPSSTAGERITLFVVVVNMEPDGRLRITETITYDFGSNQRHGLLAYIPRRTGWAPDSRYYREWPLHPLTVKVDGNWAQSYTEEVSGDNLVVKVGDPDRTVSGRHEYELSFLVDGAFDTYGAPDPHDELYWNAVGGGWTVPIDEVEVWVGGPFPVRRVACYQGPTGSTTPCASAKPGRGGATFTARGLPDHEAVSVVLALPRGAVPHAGPILAERHDMPYYLGLHRGPWPVAAAAALALLLAGLVGARLYRVGRDRRYAGQVPGLAPAAGQPVAEEYRPLGTSPEGPVEFGPPKGVRPGLIGPLITERVGVRDVTATVVDLAVRGYLTVEDMGDGDWLLSRRKPLDDSLRPYEQDLYRALFPPDREEVTLSGLKYAFARTTRRTVSSLYGELVGYRWYRLRPDLARLASRGLGVLLIVLAVPLAALLGIALQLGILAAAVAVTGLVLVVGARFAPARTPAGSAAYAQALGFRRYIRVAEAEQIRAEEREGVFSRYLPYAVAFGEARRWVATFAAVGAATPAAVGWYGNPVYFANSVEGFGSTAATTFVSTPSSSGSSGFSGGSGGGGGGSW